MSIEKLKPWKGNSIKLIIFSILTAFVFCFPICGDLLGEVNHQRGIHYSDAPSKDPLERLADLVRNDPDGISYFKISLEVAREIYPGLDDKQTAQLETEFKNIGDKLKKKLSGVQGGRKIIGRVNKFIYSKMALKTILYYGTDSEGPDHFFPHLILKRKQATCLGLSLVYLSLCEYAGIPVFPVHSPQHIYVQYNDGNERFNIETTNKGMVFDVKPVTSLEQSGRNNTYFKPVSKSVILGDILNVISWCSSIQTAKSPLPPKRAVLAGKLSVELDKDNFSNWDTLARAYQYAKQPVQALDALKKAFKLYQDHVGDSKNKYWQDRLSEFKKAVE